MLKIMAAIATANKANPEGEKSSNGYSCKKEGKRNRKQD